MRASAQKAIEINSWRGSENGVSARKGKAKMSALLT